MVGEKPWLAYYGEVPETLQYPEVTIYEALMRSVTTYPTAEAWEFLGTRCTYADFGRQIDRCAAALDRLGLSRGDRITIAMPTSPQGIICFYAANRLGAVASMIHPLSAPEEVAFYLNLSRSRIALTLDAFYGKFAEIAGATPLERLILARIPDYLGPLKALGFRLTVGRKIPPVPDDPRVVWWKPMLAREDGEPPPPAGGFSDPAVILYSGGTTGTPKGILLSNRNIICEGMQVSAWGNLSPGDSILAILPIFHGFGLGVCVNAAFMGGAKSILVPKFTPEDVARLIKKCKPSFLIGVPTLFEALNRSPVFQSADLRCLKAAFSGADQLPRTVKERFEATVQKRGGDIQLREGYGLTEAVTAIAAMPMTEYREGSVGIPFPDMSAKIVRIATTEEAPTGEEGEICFHGPAVMMGYLDQPEETAQTLRVHPDGKTWLHTGDVGTMDEDGFLYFKLRLKRMIKSSGMNVYPAQVEDVLYRHPDVAEACIIGVPDETQVQRVKGFVVLKDPRGAGPEKEKELIDHCRKHLIKWSCPRQIAFIDEMPKTLIGKVAFKELEDRELEQLRREGKYTGDT